MLNSKRRVLVSKSLSKHLRHTPGALGLTLEPGGWVLIEDLLAGATRNGFPILRDELDEVVATNEKQRFAIDEAGTRIRANQGHSASVDLQLCPVVPPEVLYHGTAVASLKHILSEGLSRMSRHHVHLSTDTVTARKVGGRHGTPVILEVASGEMHANGHVFFCSDNGVWLVEHVPPRYLRVLTPEN